MRYNHNPSTAAPHASPEKGYAKMKKRRLFTVGLLLIGIALAVPLTVCFRPNSPPTAIFTCNHSSGYSPLTVQFDASLSYDSDGEIIRYEWDFGNGETADYHYQKTAATQYVTNVAYTYVVTLTIVDDDGVEGSTEVSIMVSPPEPEVNLPPIAKFTCDSLSGTSPLLIHVDASASYDSDGEIVLYHWNFGNGDTESYHYVKTTSALYITDTARTYIITLTVTDDDSAQATETKTISVEPQPPLPEPEEIYSWSGHGPQVTPFFVLSRGLAIFRMTHNGSSNFAVVLKDSDGEWVDLLANVIGSFDGSKSTHIERTGSYLLDITADGDWSVVIKQ